MAVLWAVAHFRPCLWGRRFTLVTDCSAFTWPKLHRWALKLMEYGMVVQWRPGTSHQLPDALLHLTRFAQPGRDVDNDFLGDAVCQPDVSSGSGGSVLVGVALNDIGESSTSVPVAVFAAAAISIPDSNVGAVPLR